jgi:hypothetical protein
MAPKVAKKTKKSKAEIEAEKLAREEEERKARLLEEKRQAEENERIRLEEIRKQAERDAFRTEELARLTSEYEELLSDVRYREKLMISEESAEVSFHENMKKCAELQHDAVTIIYIGRKAILGELC